jgi:acetylornithine deacetylase/succinyl-diaminopimelate desuccinylase-like protein
MDVFLARPQGDDFRPLAREILKQLIEMDTTHSTGSTTVAAEALAARLRAAGFPESDVVVAGPNARKGNLVARLRGTGKRPPVLFLAHLDVVEARREDWSVDPFTFLEKDGYFYGRGTTDIKNGIAILVTNFIRLKQQGFRPDRDFILALTADEEGGPDNGVDWLLRNHRELIDAEYCINIDGGDFQQRDSRPRTAALQVSEKHYVVFHMEVRSPGGHSSLPSKDNAIYRLTEGLGRLGRFEFPAQLNEVTREYFSRMSRVEEGALAEDMKSVTQDSPDPRAIARLSQSPYYNALLRTTCVPTMLEGGHAPNALPQTARATINCRLLPGHSPQAAHAALIEAVNDPQISVTLVDGGQASPASVLNRKVLGSVERVVTAMWPGVPVVPTMEAGATDGYYLRRANIPTYCVSGVFIDMDDVRAHGKDERVAIESFYNGMEFYHRLMRSLGEGGGDASSPEQEDTSKHPSP